MGAATELKQQIKELSEKIVFLENKLQQNQKDLIKQTLTEFTNQKKKDTLKSEFLRKFNKSKKTVIKQKILETIRIKPLTLPDLKYYIVNQLEYCSKASFYRYIEEMKENLEIKDGVVYLLETIER